MNSLLLDWLCLYLQVFLLSYVIIREILLKSDRNLFAILVPATILILVQGQAWWILGQFETMDVAKIDVVNNSFSLDMARKANLYYGICTIFYVSTFQLFRKIRWFDKSHNTFQHPNHGTSILSYLFIAVWTLIIASLLFSKAGGLDTALTKPGQLIEGQTVFILALGIAKLPLIVKLNSGSKIVILDFLFFGAALVITLFNSRFLTAFALLQLLIVINYRRKEISRRTIFMLIVPAIVVFFVFGIYRDFAYRFGTVGIKEAINTFIDPSIEFNILDWFYRNNIEGFSGLAGILYFQKENLNFQYDFGLSELGNIFNYIPNSIRNDPNLLFAENVSVLKESFPYKGSVVPGGFELAYGHFGLPGMILYSFILGILTPFLHSQLRKKNPGDLPILLVSVQLLNGIRLSLFGAIIFFGLADVITLWMYRLLLKLKIRKE
ncbi:MAG: hypothetical protein ABIN97_09450 [Ginsengibacter sp.]